MSAPITGLYAAILFLILAYLGFQIGTTRARRGISILHGDDMDLAEKVRRHANFTENVPLALILLLLIELGGASAMLLHGLGATLVAARVLHPIGLRHDNIRHPARAAGAFGTLGVTLVAAGVAARQFLA